MVDMKEKGKRLEKLLEESGLTQVALAEMADTSDKYISQVVTGRKQLGMKTARKIAKVLNVRYEYLLGEDAAKTEADFDMELLCDSLPVRIIGDALKKTGFDFMSFEHSERPIYDSKRIVDVPDRYYIQWNPPFLSSDNECGEYVCSAEEFHLFADSLCTLLHTQAELFLEHRCHPITEEERLEKEKLNMSRPNQKKKAPPE